MNQGASNLRGNSNQLTNNFASALTASHPANNPFINSENNTPSIGGEDHVAAFEIS
jgi:hypothetical protein